MKIFSTRQLKEADRVTMEKQDITSDDLMERAGTQVFQEINKKIKGTASPIKIFCGTGNNGGDGLVIARLLSQEGYDVSVFIVDFSEEKSCDFTLNYDRLKSTVINVPVSITSEKDFPRLERNDIVVDAIFGIGLSRPLEGWVANLVRHINRSGAFIFSVDMPSGLFTDEPSPDSETIIKANSTFTFQTPKLVFYLPQTAVFAGDIEIIDIGLDEEYLQKAPAGAQFVQAGEALDYYRPRNRFSHKGTYGHALVVGGSYGKMGSISLTGRAALKAGAGMVTFFAPRCGYEILQAILPEAMVITDKEEDYLSDIEYDLEPAVISFGVGVGKREETKNAFEGLLQKLERPIVIDADGLNLLAYNRELISKLPKGSVLTPHPKELERLIGKWGSDFEKLEKARSFVKEHEVILVLKGSYTITVTESNLFVNSTGNPGMATAGSGDVLTGVITGLISQQYEPLAAAVFGVYLHGLAGDLTADKTGFEGMVAGDIADNLGAAYLRLSQPGTK